MTYYGPLKKKMTPGCDKMRSEESMLMSALGNSSRHMRGTLSTVILLSSNCQHVIPYTYAETLYASAASNEVAPSSE